eukprot:jgi/Chlat1/3780/Chrsp259S03928
MPSSPTALSPTGASQQQRVRAAIKLLDGAVEGVNKARSHREACASLALRLGLVRPVLHELLLLLSAPRTGTSARGLSAALDALLSAAEQARDTIAECAEGSRMYLLLHGRKVTQRLRSHAAEIDRALALLPVAELNLSPGAAQLIELVRSQLRDAQFAVHDERVATSQRRAMLLRPQSHESAAVSSEAVLTRSAEDAQAPQAEEDDLRTEVAGLERDLPRLREENEAQEDEYMKQISSMLKDYEKKTRYGALSPTTIQAYRKGKAKATAMTVQSSIVRSADDGCELTAEDNKALEKLPAREDESSADVLSTAASDSDSDMQDDDDDMDASGAEDNNGASTSAASTPVKKRNPKTPKRMPSGLSSFKRNTEPPRSFLCPITMEIMVDPVIITDTLQTCDRRSAQAWFLQNNTTCPITGAKLHSFELLPNLALRHSIEEWAEQNGVSLPQRQDCDSQPGSARHASRMAAAGSIDALEQSSSGTNPAAAGGTINRVVRDPICNAVYLLKHGTQRQKEAAARVLRNLAMSEQNKVTIAMEGAIPLLIMLLKTWSSGGQEAAAGALCNLCDNDAANKREIAREGATVPLVMLLRHGTADGQEAAAEALRNLSAYNDENTAAIAKEAAIPALVLLLKKGSSGGKEAAALALANLALNQDNQVITGREGAIPLLVKMLKTEPESGQAAAASALCNLSFNDENELAIAKAGAIPPLKLLAKHGNDLGRRAATMALKNLGIQV